ncbi:MULTISPECIES: hypothetical protein [unclassified Nonomuraea]|uniref:hypothetical protein n=1 Tax=unclassified Nonomuraea TaxID=2593643 RepID=UPI0033D56088
MDGPAFITALINDLQEVRRHLGDELSAELDRLLEQLRQAGDDRDALEELTLDIVELVEPELPPGHPVREAITSAMRFDNSGPREWDTALSRIRAVDLAGPYPGPEHLLAEIHTSLLAAPAYRPDDVLDGHDPNLVRLSAGDGTTRVPAFQFDADGLAIPVVLLINRLLDVDDDPWGVAGWWLYGNAWLGAAPAELLGADRDDDLVAAAQAELEGF